MGFTSLPGQLHLPLTLSKALNLFLGMAIETVWTTDARFKVL
jgi:hypothetical protein